MEWTAERIAGLTIDQVKVLRDNAVKRKAQKIVDLCDANLAQRSGRRAKRATTSQQTRNGEVVRGFHFVCPDEKGLSRNRDGTVWTGTWVVDTVHAERAVKIGAYVALHTAKSEPSYLQGTVRDWRSRERERSYAEGQVVKTKFGVDFLIEPTDQPLPWHGDGSGEKGYFYGGSSGTEAVDYESGESYPIPSELPLT